MNAKQVKLLRYFTKATGNSRAEKELRAIWPYLTHKRKGEITKMLQTTCAINEAARNKKKSENLDILKGLISE